MKDGGWIRCPTLSGSPTSLPMLCRATLLALLALLASTYPSSEMPPSNGIAVPIRASVSTNVGRSPSTLVNTRRYRVRLTFANLTGFQIAKRRIQVLSKISCNLE